MTKLSFIFRWAAGGALLVLLAACGQVAAPEGDTTARPEAPTPAPDAANADSGPLRIENGGDVPFYARFGENETFDNGEWTVIVFYRPPDCIPADFNLSQFFHFPDENGPGAFGCAPTTTTGTELWETGPETDPAPLEAEMAGRGAVPVWFIANAEMQTAMEDGIVTIDELEALPSRLVGTATTYSEFLRPTQSSAAPMIQFSAEGTLESGAPFGVDVSKGAPDVADHVTIDIGG